MCPFFIALPIRLPGLNERSVLVNYSNVEQAFRVGASGRM